MAGSQADIVLADFESETFEKWQVEGSAFGPGPARGTLPNQMEVSGYKGRYLANSYHGGDDSKGSLTSPPFKITHKWLSFLIGGGFDEQNLAIQLLVDGRLVRTATGPNKVPGGTEALHQEGWDLAGLQGKIGVIKIVDSAQGGWGHITTDHILFTNTKPPMSQQNVSRTITLEDRYLIFPIDNSAVSRKVTIKVGDKIESTNDIQLADGEADWYAFLDVSRHKGSQLSLSVDLIPPDSNGFKGITQSDEIPDQESIYKEPLRGQFHFSSRRGWLNDPNGLVFYKGEYHLFYQHNPFGWGWGNMHWGHATSHDLIHWQEHPVALFPDEMGTMFSGSAVVDWKNSSGLSQKDSQAMLLFYTAAGREFVQGLAYSSDGRHFAKYPENPIIRQIEKGDRDPKVIWHEPTKKWVMVLYLEIPGKPTIQFFTSVDLKTWKPTSRIEGYHECPDLFELPVIGQPGISKWVLTGANSDYQVGSFDGEIFTPETEILKGHQGKGFYAAQTFSDVPDRRIQIGWFQTETKGMPFNQSMSIPMELSLNATVKGPRLAWKPIAELAKLHRKTFALDSVDLDSRSPNPLEAFNHELLDISFEVKPDDNSLFEASIRGTLVQYSQKTEELIIEGRRIPAPLKNGVIDMRILCDRNGLEIFACGGTVFIPWPFAPAPGNLACSLRMTKGIGTLKNLMAHELGSAWK